jgi:hypothetical protein
MRYEKRQNYALGCVDYFVKISVVVKGRAHT